MSGSDDAMVAYIISKNSVLLKLKDILKKINLKFLI